MVPLDRKPITFPIEPSGVTERISRSRVGSSTPCRKPDAVITAIKAASGSDIDPTSTISAPALTRVTVAVTMRGPMRSASTPPARMPSALPNRNPVSAVFSSPSGMP